MRVDPNATLSFDLNLVLEGNQEQQLLDETDPDFGEISKENAEIIRQVFGTNHPTLPPKLMKKLFPEKEEQRPKNPYYLACVLTAVALSIAACYYFSRKSALATSNYDMYKF